MQLRDDQVGGMVPFCTKAKQGLGRWSGLPKVRSVRPSPDSLSGVLPTAPHCFLDLLSNIVALGGLWMCPGLLLHFSTWTSGNGWARCLQSCPEVGFDSLALALVPCRWARICCVPQATAHRQRVENFLILQLEEV